MGLIFMLVYFIFGSNHIALLLPRMTCLGATHGEFLCVHPDGHNLTLWSLPISQSP